MDRGKFGRTRWTDHNGNIYTDRNTVATKRRRKYGNYSRKYWNPLQTLDIEPKIRNKLSKKSAPCKGHFQDEITFLRRQVSEALAKKVDTPDYLSNSTVAVNPDEPPVNGDLVNSELEESAICSDSEKTNTKEKSNTETNVNSNANNNIERQRKMKTSREQYEKNITVRKIKNESQTILILRESMIKNIKERAISKNLHNVYIRHFSGAKVCCMKDCLKPPLRENPGRYKWSRFWPVSRSDCKIHSRSCVQFKNRQAWCDHFKHRNTNWSFHGKSKWGKQMFDWTFFWKKLFIDWPFQDYEILALEWE